MIEIIKPGKVIPPVKYVGVCKRCGCETRCDAEDRVNYFVNDFLPCPNCGTLIMVFVETEKQEEIDA